MGRQGRAAKAHALLAFEQLQKVGRGRAIAACLEHPLEQLLGCLAGLDVEQVLAVLGEHQARLQFQEGRDQDDELGGRLQVQLATSLEMVEVGEYDICQLELEQIHLLAQDQGEQEVERTVEDLQVEIERGKRHRPTVPPAVDRLPCTRARRQGCPRRSPVRARL